MGCVGGVSKCGDDCVTICVENTFIYLLSLYFHQVSLCDREEKFGKGIVIIGQSTTTLFSTI